jgi:RNA polymerase sigma-70 factor (ECF subfamily)
VLLPMAIPDVQAENAGDPSIAAPQQDRGTENSTVSRPKTNWPTIVSTTPKIGATDVDPNIDAISVTFDRDMDVGGYSWTGSGEFHPPTPPGVTPVWIDKRTCELPVRLKKAWFYRVGINSTSFQNFRSALGVPAPTSAIYFCTAGAPRAMTIRVRAPRVVKMSPENGATGVDPGLKMIRVTFDMPMSIGSHSWTGGGPTFPTVPAGKTAGWSPDGKTATLPVELKPGTKYELGLNSVHHKNFGSKWGVPLEPVRYEFRTAGEAPAATADDAPPVDPAGPPRIVKMSPENGANKVDPGLTAITVTFDRPMAGGFSWTGGGEHYPTIPAGQKPSWSADKKTCKLPVALKPNWQYRLGLNSPSFKNFASVDGVPLDPVVYQFQTGPAN